MTTTLTGRNQITLPAKIVKKHGLKRGMRLEWIESKDASKLIARIIAPTETIAAQARALAAKNKKARKKLGVEFESERAYQRKHDRKVI